MIKLLMFDAGGLLWTTPGKRYEKVMSKFFKKYDIDGNIVKTRWEKIKSKVEIGKIKYRDSAKIEFKGMNVNKKILEEWNEMHMGSKLIGKKLYPYVRPTLRKLKRYYKLAMLTDDYKGKEQKIKICKKLGINDIFDGIFSSQDIGYKKPQKKAFFIVLNHFKVKPTEAIFVGHSKDEIESARKFKIKTIAINWDESTKSDFYIKRFSEIPKVLERIK
jgi:HAD superfamily hydrolase (TIGR01509 family)